MADHNSMRYSAEECWEIKKLAEQYHEQLKQQRGNSAPSHKWEGKQKADPTRRTEWGFRKPKGTSRPYAAIVTPSPATTSVARRFMSCSEILGTSPLITSSRTYAERWRQLHLPQGRPHTTGG
jgi:hypothetical protein